MFLQQLEKLKSLINVSTILTPEERAEWLALLDLMNDKQLMELEDILIAGSKPKNAANAQTIGQVMEKAKALAPASASSNFSSTTAGALSPGIVAASGFSGQNGNGLNKQEDVFHKAVSDEPVNVRQMPNLSHIVNLTDLENSAFIGQAAAAPLAPKPPVLTVKNSLPEPASEKKRNSFADKLKLIFSEKELPAGSQNPELDLPAGDFFAQAKKQEPFGRPTAAPQAVSGQKSPRPEPLPSGRPAPVQSMPLSGSARLPYIPTNVLAGKAKGLAVAPGEPNKPKEDVLALIQKHQQDSRHNPVENQSASVNLQSLNDLTSLSSGALETENLAPLIKSIKNLIRKYGYHEAIFKVEKSPAYKNYIQTGLELLSKQIDFENLGPGQADRAYLSRRQFENMADLLRQIQAG